MNYTGGCYTHNFLIAMYHKILCFGKHGEILYWDHKVRYETTFFKV